MKKILLAILLVLALVSIACQSTTLAAKVQVKDTKPDPELIKNTTLLIVVENIQKAGITLAYDMATLVKVQNENFLVTHNHWYEMLQDMNIIEIRDAGNKMIRPMYASEFKSLIVYQDAGTMILRVPDNLADTLTPADLGNDQDIKPGDTVQVAHHRQPDRDKVEVLDAVVEDISVFKDTPVYTLRSLNGQSLQPGDSGGGVWHNGKLVANTWTVITKYSVIGAEGNVDPDSEILTSQSHAAIIPEGLV